MPLQAPHKDKSSKRQRLIQEIWGMQSPAPTREKHHYLLVDVMNVTLSWKLALADRSNRKYVNVVGYADRILLPSQRPESPDSARLIISTQTCINAADSYLQADVGFLMAQAPAGVQCAFYVITNDKGYRALSNYVQSKGHKLEFFSSYESWAQHFLTPLLKRDSPPKPRQEQHPDHEEASKWLDLPIRPPSLRTSMGTRTKKKPWRISGVKSKSI